MISSAPKGALFFYKILFVVTIYNIQFQNLKTKFLFRKSKLKFKMKILKINTDIVYFTCITLVAAFYYASNDTTLLEYIGLL